MKEKIIYVAEDGTEFQQLEACRNYETYEMPLQKLIELIDSHIHYCDSFDKKEFIKDFNNMFHLSMK